ncbi:putative FBD-associated F-box protein At1g61330 [Triticum dicoccoides]|uniref:putative FBD-associated F-box protein At1g61330 n=1 Tax=Triticum dicoccoides TaxID=85692 RepID=UPI000E79A531|nr:putative FBD-associated F-box protein At1g61330 [Triticum dicoccoides]
MGSDQNGTRKRHRHSYESYRGTNFKKTRAKVQFADLSEDLLSMILSKLPLKDTVRTGILSSKWKDRWKICPKLRFNVLTVSNNVFYERQHTQKFIKTVNAVMQQHQGTFVEELMIKFGYDNRLVNHINTWVAFAVSAQTKSLALDLPPGDLLVPQVDQYRFPFNLLDNRSIFWLRHLQLSFASFELPPQFNGFPNLRTLDLLLLRVTRKDLQDLLSNCINLEWFSMVRCHLNDELTVVRPLSKLLYLRVGHCKITKIVLNAMKLKTFMFYGRLYPVDLGDVADLKHAFLDLYTPMTLEYALSVLPKVLPSVQDLTLRASFELKMPLWMTTPCKFSNLKCLVLRLDLNDKEDGNILSLAYFLSVSPFVEKLAIYFHVFGFPHRVSEPIKSVPRCPHNHLKNLHITGFSGTTTQLEFLVHVVESAHALEILMIKGSDIVGRRVDHEWIIKFLSLFRELERKYLHEIISPNVKLSIISREYRMLELEKDMNFLAEIRAASLCYAARQ